MRMTLAPHISAKVRITSFRSCVAARTLVGFAQRENGKPAEVRYPQLRLVLG
jgi:hypothetical protein